MRLIVAAVGRLKDAERELVRPLCRALRCGGRAARGSAPSKLSEINESRAATAVLRNDDEAARLMKAAAAAEVRVVLDAGGRALSSEAFARWLAEGRDGGAKAAAFLIGGPDGHGAAALNAATRQVIARADDAAARARPHRARRAALSRRDDPFRSSVSSRVNVPERRYRCSRASIDVRTSASASRKRKPD